MPAMQVTPNTGRCQVSEQCNVLIASLNSMQESYKKQRLVVTHYISLIRAKLNPVHLCSACCLVSWKDGGNVLFHNTNRLLSENSMIANIPVCICIFLVCCNRLSSHVWGSRIRQKLFSVIYSLRAQARKKNSQHYAHELEAPSKQETSKTKGCLKVCRQLPGCLGVLLRREGPDRKEASLIIPSSRQQCPSNRATLMLPRDYVVHEPSFQHFAVPSAPNTRALG